MMDMQKLEDAIDAIWRDGEDSAKARALVNIAIAGLDRGELRIAEPDGQGGWITHAWLKKAVLLSFRLNPLQCFERPGSGNAWDRIPLKTESWDDSDFRRAGFRMVPPATVRRGAYIAPGVVLMPSFVNIGAFVGANTMIDTWASVGSCAQIGARCHISAGAGIGGVLEPLQANPVIIEDDVFVGARSEVVEGVIVRRGAVLSMGVFLTASTKIVDRQSGQVSFGEVPPFAVVVPGVLPGATGSPALACAVIVKTVDAKTRAKTAINDLLRD